MDKKPKARVRTALRTLRARALRLQIADWVSLQAKGRHLALAIDEEALAEAQKLDGCYVIKTDLLDAWALSSA